jgi:hypothetical protein
VGIDGGVVLTRRLSGELHAGVDKSGVRSKRTAWGWPGWEELKRAPSRSSKVSGQGGEGAGVGSWLKRARGKQMAPG